MDSSQFNQRQGIFFYVGKQLIPQSKILSNLANESLENFYNKYKDPDGFLYITYSEM